MPSIITATTTSGLTQSADNSGVLQLASGTGNLVTVPSVTGTMALTASPTFTGTATIPTATVTTLNTPTGVLATQNGMTGIAKAWVQFNGSSATIAGSFNVSSITRNGTGDYTVNFTTAMPNANYAASGFSGTNRLVAWNQSNVNYSTTALRVAHTTAGSSETDDRSERVSVCIFSS